MKNPKILYILISILCFLAIIAGIYAQFFVEKTDNDNVIPPVENQTGEDDTTEKTSEEIKSQFTNLFTNVLNSNNYDTSNVAKIVDDKDIIYSAYDITESTDNYEVNIHLPVINISGEIPANFNNITQTVFADKASEVLKNTGDKIIYQINYVAYINGDILSLAINATLKEGSNPQRVIVQTYNYNLATGEEVKLEEILSQKNLVQSEVQNKINETIQKAKQEAEIMVQSGYPVYNRDLTSEIYKLSNISNYCLGPNGNLYIIFAYGNQNHTSAMDIVLYE